MFLCWMWLLSVSIQCLLLVSLLSVFLSFPYWLPILLSFSFWLSTLLSLYSNFTFIISIQYNLKIQLNRIFLDISKTSFVFHFMIILGMPPFHLLFIPALSLLLFTASVICLIVAWFPYTPLTLHLISCYLFSRKHI